MTMTRQTLINEFIFKHVHAESNDGLLNGKMGIAIYLFHLSKQLQEQKYIDLANELIDQIYEGAGNKTISTDFENGLAGIAWGIEHLVTHGFLEADTDEILRDLDDKIFQYLTTTPNLSIDLNRGLLGYGNYLLSRLEGKNLNNAQDHDFLLKRLLITVINSMYELLEEKEELFREPGGFDSTWNLPLLLIFLSEVSTMDVHTHKIKVMMNRLSSIVCAMCPVNYGNRIFLVLSIEKVIKVIEIKKFQEHHKLLSESLMEREILQQFQDKNILLNKGLAGLQFILTLYPETDEHHRFHEPSISISEKIVTSEFWKEVEKKEKMHSGNLGLLTGLAGVGMSLIIHHTQLITQNP